MSRPTPPTDIRPTIVVDLYDLARLLALRRHEIGFSQLELDDAAGLADGHTAKIEAGYRGLGQVTLPLLLGALGVDLRIELVVRDSAQVREPFRHPGQRSKLGMFRFRAA